MVFDSLFLISNCLILLKPKQLSLLPIQNYQGLVIDFFECLMEVDVVV
jgi:hypothetical protein